MSIQTNRGKAMDTIVVNQGSNDFKLDKAILGSGYLVRTYINDTLMNTDDFNSIHDAMRFIADQIVERDVLSRGSFN
jgi:hypothetical protein